MRTVAVGCETPELGWASSRSPGPNDTAQTLVGKLAGALSLPAPAIQVGNDVQTVKEIRGEFYTNSSGHRDAQ